MDFRYKESVLPKQTVRHKGRLTASSCASVYHHSCAGGALVEIARNPTRPWKKTCIL